jgi:hypothetical protein
VSWSHTAPKSRSSRAETNRSTTSRTLSASVSSPNGPVSVSARTPTAAASSSTTAVMRRLRISASVGIASIVVRSGEVGAGQ